MTNRIGSFVSLLIAALLAAGSASAHADNDNPVSLRGRSKVTTTDHSTNFEDDLLADSRDSEDDNVVFWLADADQSELPPWIRDFYEPGDEAICPEVGIPAYKEMYLKGLTLKDEFEETDEGEEEVLAKEEEEAARRLQTNMALFPYACNEGVDLLDPADTVSCTPWSVFIAAVTPDTSTVKIACGECVAMDIFDGAVIDLPNGLLVVGRLFIPDDARFEMVTPFVIVEGLFEIAPPPAGATVPRFPGVAQQMKFVLTGTNDIVYNRDKDLDSTGDCVDGCSVGMKPFVVAGGRVDINGIDDACPTHTKLQTLNSNRDVITLMDSAAANCWAAGAEIVFTSDIVAQGHTDNHVATISSVNTATGAITLVAPLPKKKSSVADSDVINAVEVALLSRNIWMEPDSLLLGTIGAHFMVFHTPDVTQNIKGVRLEKMGQEGILGRYPMHFHMCESVFGSMVEKNAVVNSNQRCYVVHGTHNLTLSENVAFNTHGHCYMLEDGGEYDNVFYKNFGTQTLSLTNVPKAGNSDRTPSTFWVTNPSNHFIGNVAAGSASSGIWFELKLTGPSASLPINHRVDPRRLPLGTFGDNVVHGNAGNGLALYPIGYFAPQDTVFTNTTAYKNGRFSIFFHGVHNVYMNGGYIADSPVGMRNFGASWSVLDNFEVIGVSSHLAGLIAEGRYSGFCRSHLHMIGVTFHPVEGMYQGTRFLNVNFEGYSDSHGCKSSNALWLESDQTRNGVFNNVQEFTNVSFDSDTNRITVCHALYESRESKVVNVAIEGDGISPVGDGFYVQENDASLTAFLGDEASNCENVAGSCLKFCPNACLRLVIFETTGSALTDNYEMVITDSSGTQSTHEKKMWRPSFSILEAGFYGAALPGANSYTISFVDKDDNNAQVWPDFLYDRYEVTPGCTPQLQKTDIGFSYPSADARCDNLVKNGDFEDGTFSGWQNFFTGLELIQPGAGGAGYALKTNRRTTNGGHVSVHQRIDVSCLRDLQDTYYLIEGKIRIQDSAGMDKQCSKFDLACAPRLRFIIGFWDNVLQTLSRHAVTERYLETNDDGSWASFSFETGVPPDIVNADFAELTLDRATGFDFLIDDWSMTSFERTNTPSVTPGTFPELTNVALGKSAAQSSDLNSNYPATKAVDDSTTTFSHTSCGDIPWWRVDLGEETSYVVVDVVIYNRVSNDVRVTGRLRDFEVELLDDQMDVIESLSFFDTAGEIETFYFGQAMGPRYVQVRLNRPHCLHLAEVVVNGYDMASMPSKVPTSAPSESLLPSLSFGPSGFPTSSLTPSLTPTTGVPSLSPSSLPTLTSTEVPSGFPSETSMPTTLINLARDQRAIQSSTYRPFGVASKGVNGNLEDYTHTYCTEIPWWRVDFGTNSMVFDAWIRNRPDCCFGRLRDFAVDVLDENFVAVSTVYYPGVVHNTAVTLSFGGVEGRYLKIRLKRNDCLHFAEVEVWGFHTEPMPVVAPMTNFALAGTASQSSVYRGMGPEIGNDGNTLSSSYFHTNCGEQSWWEVDLGGMKHIYEIVIFNGNHFGRLYDFYVTVLDSTSSVVDSRYHPWRGHDFVTFWYDNGVQGQYIKISLGHNDCMHLSEVEVYGYDII